MVSLGSRIKSAWNAFSPNPGIEDDNTGFALGPVNYGGFSTIRPDRSRFRISNERSIISSIYTRMSIDISSISMRHTRHDAADRYVDDIISGLNDCLTVEANVDQAAQAFRQDIILTLFNKGVAAIVPVDTTLNPAFSGSFDIKTMRVGDVTQWYPQHVKVNLYNELKGCRQEIILPKSIVAIVENPLYSVMNEPNSTLQRLQRKLALLDGVDEATSSGKLDLIVQLPYVIKSEARRQQADQRRKDIEFQLKGSQYGIAYTDGTEKITQLNRPTENNLLTQIEYLNNVLYSELGITAEVMNGTADEATMLNYYSRTIEPILTAITESMIRTFLTKTARTQGQSIDFFRDPFKLVPVSQIAEIADKFTRNEILTSNEIRQAMGYKPSSEPKADQLVNSNMPVGDTGVAVPPASDAAPVAPADSVAGGGTPVSSIPTIPVNPVSSPFDDIDAAISAAFSSLGIDEPDVGSPPPDPGTSGDPDVLNASFDSIQSSINSAFSGLGI